MVAELTMADGGESRSAHTMKTNGRLLVCAALGCAGAGGVVLACVGDGPAVVVPQPDAGGADTSVTRDAGTDAVDASVPDVALPDSGPGTDAAPDADAAVPFDPSQLTGLVLWLDAAKVVKDGSGKLVVWPDSSDAGNNGSSFDGGQPMIFPTGLNGLPVVKFDGNVQSVGLADTASLQFGVGDYAIVAVAAYANTPSNHPTFGFGTIYAKGDLGQIGPQLIGNDPYNTTSQLFTQVAQNDGVRSKDAGYNNNVAHVFGCRRRGSSLDAIADDTVTTGTPTLYDVSGVGRLAHVGGVPPYYQALNGYVAELVAVKGTLSDPDLAKVRAYYKAKYGL